MAITFPISIMKSWWARQANGMWGIRDIRALELLSADMNEGRYFVLGGGEVQLLTSGPIEDSEAILSSFGFSDFLMQQSVVPVVAWVDGEHAIRCIGTATIISCTGYLITAAHVLMDPIESGYGVARLGREIKVRDDLNFGVLIPFWMPGHGVFFRKGFRFFPFEKMWNWGHWKQSPLLLEDDRWEHLTDVAVCKISEMPNGRAHQPLNMSLNPFVRGEEAYSLGYAEMPDIELDPMTGGLLDSKFQLNLHVSVGKIMRTFPQNQLEREVSTPGPCFDFDARIPGKMSGGPIFGAQGAVIRGVVSRSFSGEDHAYGSMLGPAMELGLDEPMVKNQSLRTLLEGGNEGMALVMGTGL
jgi:hypothetical protein